MLRVLQCIFITELFFKLLFLYHFKKMLLFQIFFKIKLKMSITWIFLTLGSNIAAFFIFLHPNPETLLISYLVRKCTKFKLTKQHYCDKFNCYTSCNYKISYKIHPFYRNTNLKNMKNGMIWWAVRMVIKFHHFAGAKALEISRSALRRKVKKLEKSRSSHASNAGICTLFIFPSTPYTFAERGSTVDKEKSIGR